MFSTAAVPFYIPTNSTQVFQFLHILTNIYLLRASLLIKEMQIKTTLRYHFSPIRLAKIKKLDSYLGKSVENKDSPATANGAGNPYSLYEKRLGNIFKLHMHTQFDLVSSRKISYLHMFLVTYRDGYLL